MKKAVQQFMLGTVLNKEEQARETLQRIKEGSIAKGDVLSVAQVAGIMAAKNTARNIPMCHNIFITGVEMDFQIDEEKWKSGQKYFSSIEKIHVNDSKVSV